MAQHIGIAAKLVVGEMVDLQTAIAFRIDACNRFCLTYGAWVRHGIVVCKLVFEFRRVAACRDDADQR